MKIFLPGTLNLEEVVKKYAPIEVPNFAIEEFALILSQIVNVKIFNRKLTDKLGFVPLHSKILQSLTRKYRLYLDYAVRAQVINEKPQFIVSEKCRHFKFFPEYDSPIVPVVDFETGFPLTSAAKKQGQINLPKKFQFIVRPFKSGLLEINAESAKIFYENKYKYFLRHPEKIPFDKQTGKRKIPLDQYNSAMINIERIVEEDYFMLLDETAGRLHTNLTNMPGQLRNFLKYDDEYLVSIDVSNCQPYLFNALLRPHFYVCGTNFFENAIFDVFEGECRERGLDSEFNMTNVSTRLADQWYKDATTTSSLITLADWVQTYTSKEVQEFWEMSVSGNYYEKFQYQLVKDIGKEYDDRDVVKVESLRTLFTANSFLNQKEAKAKRWFSLHFPKIYEIITLLKRNNKKFFPSLLQAMEAEIVLNRIARHVMNAKRKIPLFTIHDCILTSPENVEYVKHVMCEEFTRCIGAPPHLKFEYYGPENRKLLKLPYYKR